MAKSKNHSTVLGLGAVLSAVGASLCCILPVLVALSGLGSAALGAKLEPLRPWMSGLTLLLLGVAFYRAYRPVPCGPDGACEAPASRRQRMILWIVAVLALLFTTFPYYVSWLL